MKKIKNRLMKSKSPTYVSQIYSPTLAKRWNNAMTEKRETGEKECSVLGEYYRVY